MKHRVALGVIFLLSFLGFMIAGVPAAMVFSPLVAMDAGGEHPVIARVQGVWWNGGMHGRWRGQHFSTRWGVQWRRFRPGLQLNAEVGDLEASGWLGAGLDALRLEHWRIVMPMSLVETLVPDVKADGVLEVDIQTMLLSDRTVQHIDGQLRFGGGAVSWGEFENIGVPSLNGKMLMQASYPELSVSGPEGQALLSARIEQQQLLLSVYGAALVLFGISEEADPSVEIFSERYSFAL